MDNNLILIKELQSELLRNKENINFKGWLSLGFIAVLIVDLLFMDIEYKAVHASFFAIVIATILGSLATDYYKNKDIFYKLDRLCFERYKKCYDECLFDVMNEK